MKWATAGSAIRPPGTILRPICISPLRKVPAVITMLCYVSCAFNCSAARQPRRIGAGSAAPERPRKKTSACARMLGLSARGCQHRPGTERMAAHPATQGLSPPERSATNDGRHLPPMSLMRDGRLGRLGGEGNGRHGIAVSASGENRCRNRLYRPCR